MQRTVRTLTHTAIWATLVDKGIPYLRRSSIRVFPTSRRRSSWERSVRITRWRSSI